MSRLSYIAVVSLFLTAAFVGGLVAAYLEQSRRERERAEARVRVRQWKNGRIE